jgi:glycosyltransferase involved in cell wall biosynthesis
MSVRPPHVCLVSCQHSPNDVRVTHKIGKSLRDSGFRVSWVGPLESTLPDGYGIEFHCYRRLPGRAGRLFHHVPAARRAAALDGVDVYYAAEPDSAVVALTLARLRGGAAIFDVHEIFHDEMLTRWTNRLTRPLAGRLVLRAMRGICRRCDLVVGVSKTVLQEYVSTRERSLILHNSAPARFASSGPTDVMRQADNTIVVMQGKVGPHRGHEVVLRAARMASDRLRRRVRVIVFEDPTESETEIAKVRAVARRCGAQDNLDLRPSVPYAEMPALLRTCDVGMLTYSRVFGVNGLPNRLFEYMAAGLPVVAPDYGVEVAHIVAESQCGLLVDCENPDDVSEAIVRLAENTSEARRMGLNGHTAFSKRYSWEQEVQPLVEWIMRVRDK